MLSTINIKDYALIDNLSIEFSKGLNIITGETGAGKSIIIDALGLLLGERASVDYIRKGSSKAIVEGTFVTNEKNIKDILETNEIDIFTELILRREISIKGSNRCFINDTPVTLNLFKDIGDLLIDIHGQHEHQSLFNIEKHIDFLDDFGDYQNEIEKFIFVKNKFSDLLDELKRIKKTEQDLRDKRDVYEFQINEIDKISPKINEDVEIENELNVLENSEELINAATTAYSLLYEDEITVLNLLARVKKETEVLENIDKTNIEKTKEIENIIISIKEFANYIRKYRDSVELDPEKLEELRERLVNINRLKKKYGGSLESLIEHREKIANEFDLIDNYSDVIDKINKNIDSTRSELAKIAKDLSYKRKEVSQKVNKLITEELKFLGMTDAEFTVVNNINTNPNGEFYIEINNEKISINNKGIDEIEFYIKTNLGEDSKALTKIASGGEISRVMLALKTVLAKNDKLPLLIFDEIDSGISGRIAQKVGIALKNLSEYHQIIAITHLPQIAGYADYHYVVEKHQENERVVSSIRKLKNEERIIEIAKLISGEEITEAALTSAKELLEIKTN